MFFMAASPLRNFFKAQPKNVKVMEILINYADRYIPRNTLDRELSLERSKELLWYSNSNQGFEIAMKCKKCLQKELRLKARIEHL